MLSSSCLCRFFTLIVYLTLFYEPGTHGTNVTFVPQPIRFTLADLPEPYATPSSDKDARVFAVPENPTLYVPDGFTVKTYMTGLTMPRYLLYTPTGDLLVSEPNAHRISCLVDNDGDGYPDERQTFADRSNQINRPYGMTFYKEYFYVANRNSIRRYLWINGSRNVQGEGELIMNIDPNGHWTRSLLLSPIDEKLFVELVH